MANLSENVILYAGVGGVPYRNIDGNQDGFVHMLDTGNSSESRNTPEVYSVTMRTQPHPTAFYLSATAFVLVAINLVGVGGQMNGEECIRLLKKPLAVGIGMLSRFGVIPALALGIVELIQTDHNSSIGILSLTCAPAEGASTLLVLLAEGDLTFCVTLTSVNNFATIAMVPLWTILFETHLYSEPGRVILPFKDSFIIFCYIIISCMIGFLLQRKLSSLYHKFWICLPSFTIVTLVFTVIMEFYNNSFAFPLITWRIFLVSILVACTGFALGAGVAFIARLPRSQILVNCLECGTRTTYITNILLVTTLPKPEADMAKAAPVLCSIASLLPTLVLVIMFRIYQQYYEKNYMCGIVFVAATDEEVAECLSGQDTIMEEKETCI